MKTARYTLFAFAALAAAILASSASPALGGGASYVVDSTADDSDGSCGAPDCTLREAITLANGTGAGDVITFNAGLTITLGGILPSMSGGGDTIDGTGSGVIIKTSLEEPTFGCFLVTSTGNTMKGLELTDCQAAISLDSSNSRNNVIGPGNVIYDNIVGIVIGNPGATGNTIAGNKLGTTADGSAVHPGGGNATAIQIALGASNTVGGLTPADRNIVSGNANGILLATSTTLNVVTGNYLGVSADGLTDLGNNIGVQISGSAANNTVGGATAAAANLISGNATANVFIAGGTSNTVRGNIIGPDIAGSGASMFSGDGVFISASAPNNTIGPGNVISDNQTGVHFSGASSPGNVVKGNFIGTDLTGTSGVPNTGSGISFESSASGNTIGGTNPGDGNVIAFNTINGVRVSGAASTGNSIRGNSIHDNVNVLEIDNVTGGNTELAAPTILNATVNGVGGTACANCLVEVFSDDASDAEVYEGTALADGSGDFLVLASIIGPNVTATATDAGGNTSELSVAKVGLDPDTDGDGVADGSDNCLTTSNPDQDDADGDEDGDACDNCPNTQNANQDDFDNDTVGDLCDNCYGTANGPGQEQTLGVGNQSDADGDGLPGSEPASGSSWGGDACDADDDNDGVPDTRDACRTLAEDYDGWEDGDNCPDTDNDGDGVCDSGLASVSCTGSDSGKYCFDPAGTLACHIAPASDCRNIAEDYDNFKDSDGCPEPDNDNDGFQDFADNCPGSAAAAGADGMLGAPQDLNHNGVRDIATEALFTLDDVVKTFEDYDTVLDGDGCHDSPDEDFDGDGYSDDNEALKIGTNPGYPCGIGGWPSDLLSAGLSENKLDVQDIISFIAPVRRLDSNPGPGSNYLARWDLTPGANFPFTNHISIFDITTMLNGVVGSPAYPPMFEGPRAFGRVCPLAPQ